MLIMFLKRGSSITILYECRLHNSNSQRQKPHQKQMKSYSYNQWHNICKCLRISSQMLRYKQTLSHSKY